MFVILKQDPPLILLYILLMIPLSAHFQGLKKCVATKIIDRIYIMCNYYGFDLIGISFVIYFFKNYFSSYNYTSTSNPPKREDDSLLSC